jgi:hypothetical protein
VPAESPQPTAPVEQVEPDSQALVQVRGVETLKDYAGVSRLLGAVEGVRHVDVTEVERDVVTFRVLVRGGSATLDRALAGSPQLTPAQASGDRLVYQYKR